MCPYTQKTSGHLVLLLTLALTCAGMLTREVLPGLNICGKPSRLDVTTKIINGNKAQLGAYPWMALIGYDNGTYVFWDCGGSLISDQYVITAAHCLRGVTISETKVRLGELDLDPSVDDKATPIDFDVTKIISHNFKVSKKDNDIGLIELKDKVSYTDNIRPICLPPPEFQEMLFVGSYPTIAGWGKSEKGDNDTNTRLLEAEVEIKDTASCRTNITSVRTLRSSIIDHRVLCASAPDKDSCTGDSGGPMVLHQNLNSVGSDSFGNYFLIGIVSYGHLCGEEGYPGVYTRVSEYMPWILDNMHI